MRRAQVIIQSALISLLPSAALAHHHHELGHHWESPAYLAEMNLQIVLMAIGALVIGVAIAQRRTRRGRRAQ